MNLKVGYDAKFDILDLSEDGIQIDVVEVCPRVNLGLDSNGTLLGLEIFEASELLGKSIVEPLRNTDGASIPLNGSLADLDAQLRPANGGPHKDYLEDWPDHVVEGAEAEQILQTLRSGIAALLQQTKDEATIT